VTREELLEALAKILAGLQVSLSMPGGSGLLGAADEPYRKVLAETGFGWKNAEDFKTYLEGVLG